MPGIEELCELFELLCSGKKNPVGEEKLNSIITLPSVNCESLGNMKRCFGKDVKHSKD